jgi:methyl-accepting chemotaxis protein
MASAPDRVDSEGTGGGKSAQAVADDLAALRRRVAERIAMVNEMTEREVLSAGASVEEIVRRASDHVSWLRDGLARFSDDQKNTLAHRQTETIKSHVSDMGKRVTAHDECAQRAVDQVALMVEAATRIGTLSHEAKILAFNARIEAGRASGAAGRCFSTIAEEMKRLSQSVAEANERVQTMASSLRTLLPQMAAQTHELRQRVDHFAEEANRQIVEGDEQAAEMRRDITSTLSSSDDAVAQVLNDSHKALSHLQFQDVAAQRLLHIDAWIREVQLDVLAALGAPPALESQVEPARMEEGGNHVTDTSAGDVMLF